MKQKVLTIVQDISRAQEHEWVVKYLDRNKFEMQFALINGRDSFMERFLVENHIPVWHFNYSGKKQLFSLTCQLFLLMKKQRFEVVHTHLFEASLAGLTAAWMAGIKKRVYTRHYSDYHHVWFPSAVKYDRYLNHLASHIIATSNNVKDILIRLEQVPEKKVVLIRHGIDMTDYKPGAVSDVRIASIRKKYMLSHQDPVIGAISRFTELKGLQFLIPAFIGLISRFPNAVLVLANASGDYKTEIIKFLEQIDPANYRLIEFENDVPALYKTFNCFVHIPINATAEAFGQTYLESLASRIPSVFTMSGVAPEFIVHKENALVVPYCDSIAVQEAILYILEHRDVSEALARNGYESVNKIFDIHIKINQLEQLYSVA